MKITYTKTITESRVCTDCHGTGKVWTKEYHNQLVERRCYICQGTGKRDFTWSEDATDEVADLRRALEDTTQQLHEALMANRRLVLGLPENADIT